ncbi:hypothetical protein H5410_051464 [Solanum commersonii]|uniref:Reverse transcriptase domain-containing protein n=1 Tax=Solanum commersonii TaxID=4109 RepID=A0A9J5X029_SOLCO|nr:hypothetical protein H5410_051464 [Solanum commersonii]
MCFADDLLLFLRGDVASVTMIQQCFNEFSKASGLLANLGKSSVYFGRVSVAEEVNILTRLGFSHGDFPFKYLGIPLSTQKITLIQWKPLITRITARISSWTARKLSYTGRAQLIQFVIIGIQAFSAQLFMIPTKCVGGPNLTNLRLWNKAAIDRNYWDVEHKVDKLWIQWIHTYYIKGEQGDNIQVPKHACWMIRKILEARTIISQFPMINP